MSECYCIRGRLFKRGIKVKTGSYERALIQYDWYPYKRRAGHRHTEGRPREDTGWKTATYKSKREASEETDAADTLILDFQPLEL